MQLDLLNDPLEQFKLWHDEAEENKLSDPDAMTLATANLEGKPSARTVLYKGITKGGFLIFTNYYSRKALELAENPYATWMFYWPSIYKQVRGEGYVERLTREESEDYFETRPYESKISAWVSEQSQEIPSREYLISRYKKYREKFEDEVFCPEYWGGFRLIPNRMEFWIEQDHRLHDRFCYLKEKHQWKIIRLAP
ncbi:pyridoxamine 5'-phosphate oxidase [Coxiella endosymbiont of Amblyomma nuttalli]|uniref:pyridoxamine 5'-phosphate oxidase n=1 Tax=Coxiella endosymbiont of Amblyomma nuttalli TaxID=2749996 RepID=UPI001BAD10A2|nr:pyridoxamine 5'-phosphate oxidase [Coxiella endosymbiont of Amblyomma nuttalli]QTS83934.1 Pyridoxine/pyridoxamine 5'-phosphate oxidase [Coxiella endosymbiont of Amblyomma nuttalli]